MYAYIPHMASPRIQLRCYYLDTKGAPLELVIRLDDHEHSDGRNDNAPSVFEYPTTGLMNIYAKPVDEYITPELNVYGNHPPQGNFQCFKSLVEGMRIASGDEGAPVTLAQLNPWPGFYSNAAGAPPLVDCKSA